MAFLSPIIDLARRLGVFEPPPANFVCMIGYECWGVAMVAPVQADDDQGACAPSRFIDPPQGHRLSALSLSNLG